MAHWLQSSCLIIWLCILPDHRSVHSPARKLSGRGPTQIFKQQGFLWGPSGSAWRSQFCLPLATQSVYEPGAGTYPAGEPWTLFPQRCSSPACQATCSLLERTVLTLWFLRHGLWASGRRVGVGAGWLGLPKGDGKHYYALGLWLLLKGKYFRLNNSL